MSDFLHPLGHKDRSYFYISSSNRQITAMTPEQHSEANFVNLMPLPFWHTYKESKYYDQNNSKMNWKALMSDLMAECRDKGIFDDSRVRGIGVWKDGEHFLINLGDGLYEHGMKGPLHLDKSKYIYEIGPQIPEPLDYQVNADLLRDLDTQALIRVCKLINWDGPNAYKYLAGWLVVAPVAGALDWRPHVWLTGGAGSGKTWLMEFLIRPFIEALGLHIQGNSTEAGIRQMLAAGSRPFIFDEAESQDEHGAKRMQMVMELARQASSTGGGQVVKGSPSGNAVAYRICCSCLMSSIRTALLHESDRSRFTVIKLGRKNENSDAKFDELQEQIKKITPEYIHALFTRTFRNLPLLRETIKVFWNVLRKKNNPRVGQQYGALLGGYWSLLDNYDVDTNMRLCDRVPTEAEAEKLCEGITQTLEKEQREERECFDYLIAKQIDVGLGDKGYKVQQSIADLIVRQWREPNEVIESALTRWGLRFLPKVTVNKVEMVDCLVVANKHPELGTLYRGTKWAQWGNSLERLDGALKGTVGMRSLGPVYSVVIPLKGLMDKEEVPDWVNET